MLRERGSRVHLRIAAQLVAELQLAIVAPNRRARVTARLAQWCRRGRWKCCRETALQKLGDRLLLLCQRYAGVSCERDTPVQGRIAGAAATKLHVALGTVQRCRVLATQAAQRRGRSGDGFGRNRQRSDRSRLLRSCDDRFNSGCHLRGLCFLLRRSGRRCSRRSRDRRSSVGILRRFNSNNHSRRCRRFARSSNTSGRVLQHLFLRRRSWHCTGRELVLLGGIRCHRQFLMIGSHGFDLLRLLGGSSVSRLSSCDDCDSGRLSLFQLRRCCFHRAGRLRNHSRRLGSMDGELRLGNCLRRLNGLRSGSWRLGLLRRSGAGRGLTIFHCSNRRQDRCLLLHAVS